MFLENLYCIEIIDVEGIDSLWRRLASTPDPAQASH
jgi:hypothetical protein